LFLLSKEKTLAFFLRADAKYEGKRRKYGSLNGKLSQFESMFKELAEREFLTIDGDGF